MAQGPGPVEVEEPSCRAQRRRAATKEDAQAGRTSGSQPADRGRLRRPDLSHILVYTPAAAPLR